MVKIASGFGRSGLHDWLMQRISAVVLAAFTLYLTYFMLTNGTLTRESWVVLFHNEFFRVLASMTLIALVVHAWIGLWTVATDYLNSTTFHYKPTAVRLIFQTFVILFILGNLIWGLRILWGY